jgi:hypothetical protein
MLCCHSDWQRVLTTMAIIIHDLANVKILQSFIANFTLILLFIAKTLDKFVSDQ